MTSIPNRNLENRSISVKNITSVAEILPMITAKISLGNGIARHLVVFAGGQGIFSEKMWQEIMDFGIDINELQKFQPTYKEIFEVYSAVVAYTASVRHLKEISGLV